MGIQALSHGELTYPGVTERILTHPVAGLDQYKEMMHLLEENKALKVFVNVADVMEPAPPGDLSSRGNLGLAAIPSEPIMSSLNIRKDACELDFLSLGALVHRLDPGIIPFRKARSLEIHVSGGEYNVAANLSDCFGLRTGIATAMVNYPIGELVQARVREMGVVPFYKWFEHDGVRGPNIATVYSDRGYGRAPRSSSTTGRTRPAPCSSRATSTGQASSAGACAGSTRAASSRRSRRRPPR